MSTGTGTVGTVEALILHYISTDTVFGHHDYVTRDMLLYVCSAVQCDAGCCLASLFRNDDYANAVHVTQGSLRQLRASDKVT